MNVVVLCALSGLSSLTRLAGAAEPAQALPVVAYATPATTDAGSGHWSVLVQDITLARTLERWGAQAGYRVKWDAQRNFLIGAPHSVDGTFESALKAVLNSAGIRQSDYPLEACIYANTPPLVRVTRQGEQARECDAQ
ncbi:MAG: TcpQ domain-containing protein [Burkholderiaceae bacterium]